jgi:aspartyl-tRNA(Asn)/glutamyl-tRNA(Gln) amidotransferase subunit B
VLGAKQEVKNMNSFAAAERALEQLRDRQVELLEANETVELATFSAATGELRMMRTKEQSHDYRYFPEPDLPPLVLSDEWIAGARAALPELPHAKRERFREEYGLRPYDAGVLAATRDVADYLEEVIAAGAEPPGAAKWIMGPVLHDAKEHGGTLRVDPVRLAALIGMVGHGDLSEQAAKRVFAALAGTTDAPMAVAQRLGLLQVSGGSQITAWVDVVLAAHPAEVARHNEGDHKLVGFFMGKVMQESRGKADPKKVQAVLLERLALME